MPQATGNSNVTPSSTARVRAATASVYSIRSNVDSTSCSTRPMHSGSMRSAKNRMSSARSSSTALQT